MKSVPKYFDLFSRLFPNISESVPEHSCFPKRCSRNILICLVDCSVFIMFRNIQICFVNISKIFWKTFIFFRNIQICFWDISKVFRNINTFSKVFWNILTCLLSCFLNVPKLSIYFETCRFVLGHFQIWFENISKFCFRNISKSVPKH